MWLQFGVIEVDCDVIILKCREIIIKYFIFILKMCNNCVYTKKFQILNDAYILLNYIVRVMTTPSFLYSRSPISTPLPPSYSYILISLHPTNSSPIHHFAHIYQSSPSHIPTTTPGIPYPPYPSPQRPTILACIGTCTILVISK